MQINITNMQIELLICKLLFCRSWKALKSSFVKRKVQVLIPFSLQQFKISKAKSGTDAISCWLHFPVSVYTIEQFSYDLEKWIR